MPYLLDANVFIQAKNLHYSFDFCPAFWEWLDVEHANGKVYSIEKVRDELIGGDDELAEWARQRGKDFFLPLDDEVLPSLAVVSEWAKTQSYEAGAVNQLLGIKESCERSSALQRPSCGPSGPRQRRWQRKSSLLLHKRHLQRELPADALTILLDKRINL
jgi:hypothetical protein